jgi:hypothetical protein
MSGTLGKPVWLRIVVGAGALCMASSSTPASAGDGGAVAAGLLGGLAVGAVAGSAIASSARPPVYYYPPAPVYVAPPPPRCWFTPQQVRDGYEYAIQNVWVCQ